MFSKKKVLSLGIIVSISIGIFLFYYQETGGQVATINESKENIASNPGPTKSLGVEPGKAESNPENNSQELDPETEVADLAGTFAESDYFPLDALGTIYPLYPDSPLDLYIENISAAENGDGRSMYWVARVLYECHRAVERDVLEKAFALNNIDSEELLNVAEARFERCKDIQSLVGIDKLNDWLTHYEWLSKAKETMDPLADSWFFQVHPDRYSQSEAKAVIVRAYEIAGPNNIQVFRSIGTYLANYTENGVDLNTDWALVLSTCALGDNYCNQDRLKKHIESVNLPTDYEEIVSISENIVSSVKSGNVDKLL